MTGEAEYGRDSAVLVFPMVTDKAMFISVTKALSICIQDLDVKAVCMRNFTMLEMITVALLHYLTAAAPVRLNLAQLAGGAGDGASVKAGPPFRSYSSNKSAGSTVGSSLCCTSLVTSCC